MRFEDALFTSVDIETTGLDVKKDEIVAFASYPVRSTKIIVHAASYVLVKPERFRVESMKYHGISEEDLQGAPGFKEVLPKILNALDGILVGHTVRFDYEFLQKHFKRAGVKFKREVLDIALIECFLARALNRSETDLSLDAMIKRYGFREFFRHNALSDAFFAAQIFQLQLESLKRAGIRTTRDLLRIEGEYACPAMDTVFFR